MAQKFVLSAALNIQAPNMGKVVRSINQQLQGVNINLNVPKAAQTNKAIQNVNKSLKNTSTEANKATTTMKALGASIGSTIGQFIKYDIARSAINLFSRAISDGLSDAIKFEREMVKIAQVTGAASKQLKDLESTISNIATSMGVASMSLLQASRVLAQTGMEAGKVKIALEALAKTTLAPTFDSIADTTETAIAAMRQFRLEAGEIENVLGSINAVAGKFAVEAGDIGVAIRRTGGAFKSAGGQINELIALFTSVRSTTRETAETIATGFRTIFTRMQRPGTIKFLRQFGVELQDLDGHFVGPLESVKRLHIALKTLDPRDVRYSQIIEQLGGFRQVSKVIPLIQEFKVTQEALNVAIAGTGSLTADASKAQGTFAVKIIKLKEEVKELFRVISESTAFKVMLDGAIGLATALTNVVTALGPLIPMLTAVFAIRGIGALGGALGGIRKGISTQGGTGFAKGGMVPGSGNGDTVPARLTPGEFVIRKSAVQAFGAGNLEGINKYAKGGLIDYTGQQLSGRTTDISQRIVTGKPKHIVENLRGKPDVASQKFNVEDVIKSQIDPVKVPYEREFKRDKSGRKRITHDPTKDASGKGWENAVATHLGGIKRYGGSNYPVDFVKGDSVYEAKKGAWNNKDVFVKLLRHRIKSETLASGWTAGKNTKSIGGLNVMVPGKRTDVEERLRKAGGGAITSQGTDTIPALLTPGEFVVNKKSAQSMGYDKLQKINGYATGGIVGGNKNRVKMAGGGGPMEMLMLMLMGGGGGGGGGQTSSAANNASSALNNLSTTAKKSSIGLKASLGSVVSGMGKMAQSSLVAYSYVQFFGSALDSVVTSMGIENETVHKVIGGLTSFVSYLYAASAALATLQTTGMLGAMGNMFKGLTAALGPAVKGMFSTFLTMAGGTAVGGALIKGGRSVASIGGTLRSSMGATTVKGAARHAAIGQRYSARAAGSMGQASQANKLLEGGLNKLSKQMAISRTFGAKSLTARKSLTKALGLLDKTQQAMVGRPGVKRIAAAGLKGQITGTGAKGAVTMGDLKKFIANQKSIMQTNAGLASKYSKLATDGAKQGLKGLNIKGTGAGGAVTRGDLKTFIKESGKRATSSTVQAAKYATKAAAGAKVGNLARGLGKGLAGGVMGTVKNPWAWMAVAGTVAFDQLGKGAQAAADSQMKAGAEWEDLTGEMATVMVAAGGEAAMEVAASHGMMSAAARTAGAHIAAFATSTAPVNAAPVGGQIAYVVLLVAEIAYIAATIVDAMNDMRANFERFKFSEEMTRVSHVLEGFEKGIVSVSTAASTVNGAFSTLSARSKEIDYEKSTGNLGIGLDAIGMEGFWGTDNDIIAAAEEEWAKAHAQMIAFIPKIVDAASIETVQAIKPEGALNAAGEWVGGNEAKDKASARTSFMAKLGGEDKARDLARKMGTSLETLLLRQDEQVEITRKVIIANKEYEEAHKKTTAALLATMDVMLGIASLAPTLAGFESRFANIAGQTAGGYSSASSPALASQFSGESIMAISSDAQWEKLSMTAQMVTASLGPLGEKISKEFMGSARLMSVLPESMTELASDLNALDFEGGADPGQKMMDLIKSKMTEGDFKSIPEFLKRKLEAQINAMTAGAEGSDVAVAFAENQEAIMAEMTADIDQFAETMQKAMGAFDKYSKMLGAAYAQLNKLNSDLRSNRQAKVGMEFENKKRLAEARGEELTPADYEQKFQDVKAAGLQGVQGRDAITGATTGAAASDMGVGGLGDLYLTQKKMLNNSSKKLEDLVKAAADAGITTASMTSEIAAAREENRKLKEQTEQTKQALKAYTNVQERLTGVQTALVKEQEARTVKRGVLSDFAFADDEGRNSQIEGMAAGFAAVRGGGLGAVDQSQRGAVGAFLDRFENISLAGFGGKTGGELKKEFEIKELEKVMGRDLSAEEKKGIMESTSKEDDLIAQMTTIQEEGLVAQDALFAGLKQDKTALTEAITELNKTFLFDLKEILMGRELKREEAANKSDIKKVQQLEAQKVKANDLLASIIDPAELAAMTTEQKDERIKGLAGAKQSLKDVANAKNVISGYTALTGMFNGAGTVGINSASTRQLAAAGADGRWDSTNLSGSAQSEAFDRISKDAERQARSIGGTGGIEAVRMTNEATSKLANAFEKMKGGMTTAEAVAEVGGGGAMMAAMREAGYKADEQYTSFDSLDMAQATAEYIKSYAHGQKMTAETSEDQARATLTSAGFSEKQINDIIVDNDRVSKALAAIPDDFTFKALDDNLKKLTKSINERTIEIEKIKLNMTNNAPNAPLVPPANPLNKGGPVYASTGMFVPKGTDTVPAMLTPGEFVIRRNAVKAVGMPLLRRINSMGKGGRSGGGGIRESGYYSNDGDGGLSLDFSGLDQSINKFSQQVTRLDNALSGGFNINVGGEINVNVKLNGAEMLEGAKDALGQIASDKVNKGIVKMLKKHFPRINHGMGPSFVPTFARVPGP